MASKFKIIGIVLSLALAAPAAALAGPLTAAAIQNLLNNANSNVQGLNGGRASASRGGYMPGGMGSSAPFSVNKKGSSMPTANKYAGVLRGKQDAEKYVRDFADRNGVRGDRGAIGLAYSQGLNQLNPGSTIDLRNGSGILAAKHGRIKTYLRNFQADKVEMESGGMVEAYAFSSGMYSLKSYAGEVTAKLGTDGSFEILDARLPESAQILSALPEQGINRTDNALPQIIEDVYRHFYKDGDPLQNYLAVLLSDNFWREDLFLCAKKLYAPKAGKQ